MLIKSDDDGLLACLMPVWPHPAPIKRPVAFHSQGFIEGVIHRLLGLEMAVDETGHACPWLVPFTEEARKLLDEFRLEMRNLEAKEEGLMLSLIGKLPGVVVRLSLVLALMEWASEEAELPKEVGPDHFRRATCFVQDYLLPMARRAYIGNSGHKAQRSARALLALIREEDWQRFTAREVRRKQRSHLQEMERINAALKVLEAADLIKAVDVPSGSKGGVPARIYSVNPTVRASA